MKKVRVRFAPSPTGYMHIGNFRSALYDYIFAKKNGGDFILRIEDTDRSRFVSGALESLIGSLEWMGLEWDEGVFQSVAVKDDETAVVQSKNYPGILEVGENGPYIQSEKLKTYKKYADELVEKEMAYYCFCEPERLEEMRKGQLAEKKAPIYDRFCLGNLKPEEVNEKLKENIPHTIRLKMPANETIEVDDIVRGKVKFNTSLVDDQILIKSDGFPTYHLANVVDDHEMGITHVIRGEEWLSSVPKHLILYRYFGWEPPRFAHLPLLLNPDRTKLSKRQGDVAVEDYINQGYLKEALINFIVFLGWNPGQGSQKEMYSLDELIEAFQLEKVHKSGAIFDLKKLDWINSQYIKKMPVRELVESVRPFLEKKEFYQNAVADCRTDEYLEKVITLEQDRLKRLSDIGEDSVFFFQDIRFEKEMLAWKGMDDTAIKDSLEKSKAALADINEIDWNKERIEKALLDAAGEKRGELLWPLRVALTSKEKSPTPFEVAWILGKEKSLERIENSIQLVSL